MRLRLLRLQTYFFENNHEIAHNFFLITPVNSTFFNQHLEFPHAIFTIPLEIPCNICNIPPISLGYVTHVFSYTHSVLLIDLLHIRYCILTYLPTYPPTYLPTYLPTYQPTYLPTYLPTYQPTYLPMV